MQVQSDHFYLFLSIINKCPHPTRCITRYSKIMVFLLPWSLIAKGPPLWQEAIGLYASILAEHTCHEVSSIHSVYCADSVAANTTCLKACLCSRDLQIVGDLQIFFFAIFAQESHTHAHICLFHNLDIY